MLEIICILIIVVITSFFVLSEISILTSTKAKLQKMAVSGSSGAKQALKLLDMPNQFLSSVQVAITCLSIVLGMYGSAPLSEAFTKLIVSTPWGIGNALMNYSEGIGDFVAVVIITYITVMGEIIPKRVAMLYPETIASYTAYFMRFFMIIIYPFVVLLTSSVKFFLMLMRIQEKDKNVSIDEVRFIINQAELSGSIRRNERNMLQRLININSMQVKSIMTPRSKVITLDLKESREINLEKIKKHDFSYFPVIRGKINNLVGIIPSRELLNTYVDNELIEQKAKQAKSIFVPELAKVGTLIDLFRVERVKIVSVVDEYGNIEGIVSFNDILKIFLGDMAILSEGTTPDIVQKGENQYIVAGHALMSDIQELLGLDLLKNNNNAYMTLAKFVLNNFDNLPKKNDFFHMEGWKFQVIHLDALRIDRVLISKA